MFDFSCYRRNKELSNKSSMSNTHNNVNEQQYDEDEVDNSSVFFYNFRPSTQIARRSPPREHN